MSYTWDFSIVWRNIDVLLEGLIGTALLTGAGLVMAMPIGLILALVRMSSLKVLRVVAIAYIDFFRAAPALVLIVWFYFAFPILAGVNIDAFSAALLAIGLQSSSYMAEVFRSGMQAIGKGQWEAASALGLSRAKSVRYVILPQAMRHMVPVFLIRFAELIKATTLAAGIAYGEMVYRANELAAQTYRPLEVYTVTALLFFILIFGVNYLSQVVQRRVFTTRGIN